LHLDSFVFQIQTANDRNRLRMSECRIVKQGIVASRVMSIFLKAGATIFHLVRAIA